MTGDEIMTEVQAAEFLHQKPRTLRDWRIRRGLPHYKPTQKVVLYRKADLLKWLEMHRVAMIRWPNPDRPAKKRG
jgi:Helix-turn-helix domain